MSTPTPPNLSGDRGSYRPDLSARPELSRSERVDRHLRAGARKLAGSTPAGLHDRILERVRAERSAPRTPLASSLRASGYQLVTAVSLLAAALVCSMVFLRPTEAPTPNPADTRVVHLSVRDLLQLPRSVDAELQTEAQNVLIDTSRAALGLVRSLPAPLRNSIRPSAQ